MSGSQDTSTLVWDLADEAGSVENYANPKAITGRAGLFLARYQSDRVDHANGPLVRRANRTPYRDILPDLRLALDQIPLNDRADEAKPLAERARATATAASVVRRFSEKSWRLSWPDGRCSAYHQHRPLMYQEERLTCLLA